MNAFFYWSTVVRLTYPSSEVRRLVSLSIIGYDRALLANDRPQFFRSIPLLITFNGGVLRALTLYLRSARLSHIYPLSSPRVRYVASPFHSIVSRQVY